MTSEEIEKLQALFQIGQYNPITLRAINPRLKVGADNFTFHASDYPSIDERWAAFAAKALQLNSTGLNIYTCLNPILPEFNGQTVSDKHIARRNLLLIDFDRTDKPDRPKGKGVVPASDDEVNLAFAVAEGVDRFLGERFDSQPTRIMSGNGIHLLYRLDDLPNDDQSRDLVRMMLGYLAGRFNTPEIKIDTTVSNAGRITKVPGTVAYKGIQSENRPYRKAVFL